MSYRIAFSPHSDRNLSGSEPRSAAAGDFDEEGHLDVAVSHYGGVAAFLGGETAVSYSGGVATYTNEGMAAGDVNLDGIPDRRPRLAGLPAPCVTRRRASTGTRPGARRRRAGRRPR